ncbi:hypothetical protein Hamer_G032060 [Homarus americanus]|uniref:Uncharacterized protein n=1 Tax=Homarus americanus TaxID=6706 RepID=A0A8J5JXM6_HOMAM|nr:hypothetical protein Hamer_G032060 [Homarus americanus]
MFLSWFLSLSVCPLEAQTNLLVGCARWTTGGRLPDTPAPAHILNL